MSVSAVQSQNSLMQLLQMYATQATSSTTATQTGASATSASGATQPDSVSLSGPAKAYAELQKLQQSDPDKFKALTAKIADELKTAASQQTDTKAAQKLTDLASKFQSVSEGGDLSQLQPPQAGARGGHHHRSYTQSTSSDSTSAEQTAVSGLLQALQSGDSSNSGVQQLLANILSQVTQGTNNGASSAASASGNANSTDGVRGVMSTIFSQIDAAAA